MLGPMTHDHDTLLGHAKLNVAVLGFRSVGLRIKLEMSCKSRVLLFDSSLATQ